MGSDLFGRTAEALVDGGVERAAEGLAYALCMALAIVKEEGSWTEEWKIYMNAHSSSLQILQCTRLLLTPLPRGTGSTSNSSIRGGPTRITEIVSSARVSRTAVVVRSLVVVRTSVAISLVPHPSYALFQILQRTGLVLLLLL